MARPGKKFRRISGGAWSGLACLTLSSSFTDGQRKGARSAWLRRGDIDAQEAVLIGGFGLGQVEARRQLNDTLEGAIIYLHNQEPALRGSAPIRALARDAEAVALDGEFEVFTAHAREFGLDHQSLVRLIDIGVGDPMRFLVLPAGGLQAVAEMKGTAHSREGHVIYGNARPVLLQGTPARFEVNSF